MPDLPMKTLESADMAALYGGWIKRMALSLKSRMPWAELDELLQWGAIGMLEAMNRYDGTLGVAFQA
jgi:RNA polymerase sporulation-specific sigma factor